MLTDISGYTGYLLDTELEHAQDVLADLMGVVLSSLQPPLTVSKLEGDAVFSYALDGTCGASTLLDAIERAYFAFRSRQRDIDHATSCTCNACKQIPTLDLKFILHHGSFVRRDIAGNEELTGRDVIVLHRLSKNSAADVLGTKGYVLVTEASMSALELDGAALGMRPHLERYDDVGEVACHLEDLGVRWKAEDDRQRVYIEDGEASFTRTMTVPVEPLVAWEWLTSPELRAFWNSDGVIRISPGGRERVGATNHCMHGPDVLVEHVVDWHPFDYFTKSYELPGLGDMLLTTELRPEANGRTTISLRGEPLDGDRLAAWTQMEGAVLAGMDHSSERLEEQLERVARGDSPVQPGD